MKKTYLAYLVVGSVLSLIATVVLVGQINKLKTNVEVSAADIARTDSAISAIEAQVSVSPAKTTEAPKASPTQEVPKPEEKAAQAVVPTPVTGFSPARASVPLAEAVNRTPRATPYEGQLRVSWQYPDESIKYAPDPVNPCLAPGNYVHPTLGKFSVSRR